MTTKAALIDPPTLLPAPVTSTYGVVLGMATTLTTGVTSPDGAVTGTLLGGATGTLLGLL